MLALDADTKSFDNFLGSRRTHIGADQYFLQLLQHFLVNADKRAEDLVDLSHKGGFCLGQARL